MHCYIYYTFVAGESALLVSTGSTSSALSASNVSSTTLLFIFPMASYTEETETKSAAQLTAATSFWDSCIKSPASCSLSSKVANSFRQPENILVASSRQTVIVECAAVRI